MRETYGSNILDFAYNPDGSLYSFRVNGTYYYYVTNLQGDVIGIVDANGNTVASYEYDPYGDLVSATGDMAAINPMRYRGYYYDTESTLYYLQSRYYDPELGRFINADSLVSTGQGILGNNMFAYCADNPVMHSDPKGYAYKGINSQINYSEYEHTYGGHRESAIGARPDYFNLWGFVTNEDEAVVLQAEHIAFYKGTFVVKVPSMGTSGLSIGVILLGSDASSSNIVRHEYGHIIQLSQLGLGDYLAWVGAPSLYYYHETKRGQYSWNQYYDRPWELLADSFGQVNRTYPTGAHNAAMLYWFFALLGSVFT